jgi:hypothetical protein
VKRTDSFVAYSGETTNELLAYPAWGQCDSLVRAFEEGLRRKVSRTGQRALNREERTILAVRALDREVNNGGYHQFFCNSSKRFAPEILQSLSRIGCRRTAKITKRAINALRAAPLTVARIEAAMRQTNDIPREGRAQEWSWLCPSSISSSEALGARRRSDLVREATSKYPSCILPIRLLLAYSPGANLGRVSNPQLKLQLAQQAFEPACVE